MTARCPQFLLCLLLLGCQKSLPPEVDRRVPVDLIGDCVALRERISECRQAFADIFVLRRERQDPALSERLRDPAQRQAARDEVLQGLAREAALSPTERHEQCRVATAETPPPPPEDVASLHRCLPLACAERAACLRPLLLARGR